MKRVLIFSLNYYPRFIGGAEVAIKEITSRIETNDIIFDMVTLRFDSNLPKFEKIGNVNVYRIGFTSVAPEIADLVKFPLTLNKYLFPFIGFLKSHTLHKKNHYDGIWAMMANYAGFAALFFKMKYPQVPFLLTLQEGDPIEYIKHRVRFVYPLFQRIFTRADFVQTISNYLAGFARDMGYTGPLEVVPNAVNVAHFAQQYKEEDIFALKQKLMKKSGDIFLVTTSRLVKKNATDDAIRSLALLDERVKFLILGIGPDEEMLRSLAREKNVEDRVIFLGQVPHTEMPKYLKVSDIFIRPSRSEGLGNSFLEAMAAGIPVIATPVGGIPDFLFDLNQNPNEEPTGYFCIVDDAQSIAIQVKKILSDEKLRERIIINAKKLVTEKYDWSLIAKAMKEKVFDKLATLEPFFDMKILLATGIYPPQVGGPSYYAYSLHEEFNRYGIETHIAKYGSFFKLPPIMRHLAYLGRLLIAGRTQNVILGFDSMSVGLPAILAGIILRKKVVLRIGGDFLWEQYVERTKERVPLSQFYKQEHIYTKKEKIIFILTEFVLNRCDQVVFSTPWLQDIFIEAYGIKREKTSVIENEFGRLLGAVPHVKKNFIWAGRPIFLKNTEALKKAFSHAKEIDPSIHLELFDRLPREELMEKLRACYAVIYPSLSEVSPNLALEALAYGKPSIITKETGYIELLRDVALFVDPLNEADITEKILFLAKEKNYRDLSLHVRAFESRHTYSEIADEYIKLFKKLL